MIDIENINNDESAVDQKTDAVSHVRGLTKRKKNNDYTFQQVSETCDVNMLPGHQKIYIKTWGCSHNTSEGEYMSGLLSKYGYKIVDDPSSADLWILNSCTVKNPSEDAMKSMIEKAVSCKNNKTIPVVVTGCVPKADKRMKFMKNVSVMASDEVERIIEVVEETLKGNQVLMYNTNNSEKQTSLLLPKIRKNPLIEIIAISNGCLNQCTYCKTRHARGSLRSYPVEEILDRVKQAISENVLEIWLTSEDVGCYGRDIETNFVNLMHKILQVVPDYMMIRIGMTNPPYILDYLDDIIDLLKHPRIYSFLHIPIQSGSDAVLAEMNREYCLGDFEKIADSILKEIPEATIATDFICAFPTEEDADFEASMKVVKKYQFKTLYINQYYPRPGTPAASMKRIPGRIAKLRTAEMSNYFLSYKPYESRKGNIYEILITETNTHKSAGNSNSYIGHNKCYEQIQIITERNDLMGKWITAEVTDSTKFCMIGKFMSFASVNKNDAFLPKGGFKDTFKFLVGSALTELYNLFFNY